MYSPLDLHGFYSFTVDEALFKQAIKDYEDTIACLKEENKELRKENKSLGQQNAVLAGLVRATTGIKYESDYEWEREYQRQF